MDETIKRDMAELKEALKQSQSNLKGGVSKMPRRDYEDADDEFEDDGKEEGTNQPLNKRPVTPPVPQGRATQERQQVKKGDEQPDVQIVEREVTLSLINEKLNYIISKLPR